ncbi:GDSL-type esterase/lipase family protein [Kitasatospora sp. NPDC048540]|uniref:GDSL-type esterase/lipase family protein n=1 Tax=Kitasatospora sp. NPDC048540 TaxID=3155634 RepID=UPI0033D5A7F7
MGIWVPAGWGSFWRTKRDAAAAGTGKAVIAAVGSSSTQGLYSGNLLTDPFVSKLRTSLQSSYGDGGSGYFGTTRSVTFLGAGAIANAWDALPGNLATLSGSWLGGNNYGPGGQYLYCSAPGNYAQFTKVRGTTIRIYTMSGGGRVNWTYQIDGGTVTPVTDSGTPSIQVTTISGLSAGEHTVKIAHNGANGSNFSPCGVTGENATGVVVNNYGLSGAQTSTFVGADSATYQPITWNGGPNYPADLLIYALGANDASSGVAIDTYTANLRKFLSAVKDGQTVGGVKATGNTDVLILMQHIGSYDNATTPRWHDYCDRARGIAEAYGAAFVNVWPLGRNSWNHWSNQGYWGNASTAGGVSGTDPIHMSNAGHQFTADALLPILTA